MNALAVWMGTLLLPVFLSFILMRVARRALSALRFNSTPMAKLSTFQHQAKLPKLPVPDLKDTCNLYLSSVKPLVSKEAYEKTCLAVSDFQKPNGIGETLQQRLLARQRSVATSWLIDWWNDYAYMSYRDPVVIWVSYFFAFQDDKIRMKPWARAASLIRGAFLFREQIITETLEPETARSGPLCMEQYRYLFNSTRIPTMPSDTTRSSDPITNNHVVVIRNNRFYTFDVKVNGKYLSFAEIQAQLEKIYHTSPEKGFPIGLLTAENRDTWTKVRQEMLKSSQNREALDIIERAAFVVCLDSEKPVTKEEVARACWHGDGQNRFFDKSLQFIVFDNGKAGFNGEHSMMDATPTSRMCDWILTEIANNRLDMGTSVVGANNLAAPTEIQFEVSPQLVEDIAIAAKNFDALIHTQELQVVHFEGYGKNLIKNLKASPDGYAQMAIQLAFFKMNGYIKATYESAQTRKFRNGRTETCRSCTMESKAWVEAMEDPYVSIQVKGELGRKAVAAQTAYMAKAVEGKGCDRHLLGLRLLLRPEEPKPLLFTDPSYALSSHWNLSTSQITSEYYDGYGWGEVVADGWGVAYMVKEGSLHFNLTSRKLGAERFRHFFLEALREMRVVFEATVPPEKKEIRAKL